MGRASAIGAGERFSPEKLQAIADDFYREGVTVIPGVLTADECAALRASTDAILERDTKPTDDFLIRDVLRDAGRKDPIFLDLLVREPILGIVQTILGEDCRYCTSNVIRNPGGDAISHWHIDDHLEFPLPDNVARHDPRIRMPVQWMSVQMALSDIEVLEHGPTQYVPGSHYSGRYPPKTDAPEFEGRGVVSVLCKAGDIYLQNHQCGHRCPPDKTQQRPPYSGETKKSGRGGFLISAATLPFFEPPPVRGGH